MFIALMLLDSNVTAHGVTVVLRKTKSNIYFGP